MKTISERGVVVLIGAIHFVNVLDFMMVMPLGPDFASALNIPVSQIGIIGGSYTAAAAVAGVLGSFFLDRFDRRKALLVTMLGLALGTIAGGLADDLYSLMAARVLAGAFGGPATSLSLSVVADTVAPSRRGRAMGAVMGAFSLASIAGVPFALEMARIGGWRLPFFVVGALAVAITAACITMLPPMRGHLERSPFEDPANASLLRRPEVLTMYAAVALSMFGAFLMIPNISTFFQFNLGFPRERLGMLYFIGGVFSFVAMRVAGQYVDRLGAFAVGVSASMLLVVVLLTGYVATPPLVPIVVMFTGFMVTMSVRGVVVQTLSSRVPRASERARYMSFLSATQHVASALGAIASTQLLHEEPGGALAGMPKLATLVIALAVFVPIFIRQVERRVHRNEAGRVEKIA